MNLMSRSDEACILKSNIRILAYPKNQIFNPYNELLYHALESRNAAISELTLKRALFGNYEVFHIHWPESLIARKSLFGTMFYGMALLALCLWLRGRGVAIIWTAHNQQAHDSFHPGLERFFMCRFLRGVTHILHLSKASRKELTARYPQTANIAATETVHGHYLDAYPCAGGRHEALKEFGISEDSRVAVFFGLIRHYKSVSVLMRAFSKVRDPGARLIVAGRCDDEDLRTQITMLASKDNRIVLRIGFVRKEDVWRYFLAATVTILPYSEVLNSGASFLALSFGCPLLTTNKGSLGEMSELVGAKYHKTYDGDLTAGLIENCLEMFENVRVPVQALNPFNWDAIALDTLKAFRVAVGRAHG